MHSSGDLRMDPVVLDAAAAGQHIEIVAPYTEWSLSKAVLKRAESLIAGLNATIHLIAVHTVPYPLPFCCPSATHAHLVEQLLDLASGCPFAVDAQVLLARYEDDGFRGMLKPGSVVLIGTHKRLWKTREEKLAQRLAREGHKVALLHID